MRDDTMTSLNKSLRQLYGSKNAASGTCGSPDSTASTTASSSPVAPTSRGKRSEDGGRRGAEKRRRMVLADMGVGSLSTRDVDRIIPEDAPNVTLDDMGGIERVLQEVRELALYPLMHPEVFRRLRVLPPAGILLCGPPGSGKTKLAHAIAGSANVPFFKLAGPEIVSGMSGDPEARLRALFADAKEVAPCMVFIDEIDALAPKREDAAREMERRIVAQLLTCLSDLAGSFVVVVGATNRPDALDAALRRAGRFDREITLGIPDLEARHRILQVLTREMRLDGSVDTQKLARMTPGFVGADLEAVTKEAGLNAIRRFFSAMGDSQTKVEYSEAQLLDLFVTEEDLHKAVSKVQPSARREGFATIPEVTWEDVGALENLRAEFDRLISNAIKMPEVYNYLGLDDAPAGVLLYGPPGCGKTLVAKAMANASRANFIAIRGPELFNKYQGETEKAVREVFARARASSPCVIFFDELDALCPVRGGDGGPTTERVVNQLLTEMNGPIGDRREVFVVAATNRPDMIDGAMLRPGRLGKLIYVPLPDEKGRLDILKKIARRSPLADDVSLSELANRTAGYTGADLSAILREAALIALDSAINQSSSTSSSPPAKPSFIAEVSDEDVPPVAPISVDLTQTSTVDLCDDVEIQPLEAGTGTTAAGPRKPTPRLSPSGPPTREPTSTPETPNSSGGELPFLLDVTAIRIAWADFLQALRKVKASVGEKEHRSSRRFYASLKGGGSGSPSRAAPPVGEGGRAEGAPAPESSWP